MPCPADVPAWSLHCATISADWIPIAFVAGMLIMALMFWLVG
jgi:hypothetical protein